MDPRLPIPTRNGITSGLLSCWLASCWPAGCWVRNWPLPRLRIATPNDQNRHWNCLRSRLPRRWDCRCNASRTSPSALRDSFWAPRMRQTTSSWHGQTRCMPSSATPSSLGWGEVVMVTPAQLEGYLALAAADPAGVVSGTFELIPPRRSTFYCFFVSGQARTGGPGVRLWLRLLRRSRWSAHPRQTT